jgi:DNA adenine methylase
MADVVSGYLSMIDEQLPFIVDRLRTVQILSRPAIDVIRTWDSADSLIYADPPYVPTTRHKGARKVYGCEMSDGDHRELASVLHECQSKVVLSGYPSPLYDELYGDWRVVTFDIANHAAGGRSKARKAETICLNW